MAVNKKWMPEMHSAYGMGGSASKDEAGGEESRFPIYLDEGCYFVDACLACPFTDCVFGGEKGFIQGKVARDIVRRWRQPEADKARLFKAAMLCTENPMAAKVFDPQFRRELNAYGSTQGSS